MKTLAVLQPGYLPWLGFFDQLSRADIFVIYDDVQYDKHGWRNRNRIKSPQGPYWLTVPVLASDKPANRDIVIDSRLPWARKQIGTIRQFYARSPHLSTYLPALEELLQREWRLLIDLDQAVLALLCSWLDLRPNLVLASTLGIDGGQSQRLLSLCRHFEATHYLSGNAAQAYLDIPLFQQAGIEVVWQDYRHPVYPQLHGEFVSHLSVLDLLLNCGDKSGSLLRQRPCP